MCFDRIIRNNAFRSNLKDSYRSCSHLGNSTVHCVLDHDSKTTILNDAGNKMEIYGFYFYKKDNLVILNNFSNFPSANFFFPVFYNFLYQLVDQYFKQNS